MFLYLPSTRLSRSIRALPCGVLLGVAMGCTQNPFRMATSTAPINLTPPPGVAAPAHTLQQIPAMPTVPPSPSYANTDSRQLETTLARSHQESQLLQDEIAVLREQLASTSSQLAQTRTANLPTSRAHPDRELQPGGPAPSAGAVSRPSLPSPTAMQAALTQLSLPGIESRLDGNVVRMEISSDRLFESGSASLLPGGAALLSQTAEEVERLFPRHFIGIEGHIDTEPLQNASWGSPHQLTAARAATVFDFFTSRTSLRQGQLFLVAHGSNHPVVSNATAAGRARNRRVELVIYAEQSALP
ncbi:MAG: OmpA family protein [Planctomycetia bacterium]|nr:OmpA family protein [Planctomycetia bacterium]